MIKFTIITNTIRRPIELITKSIEASLAQNESASVVLVDQNIQPLHFIDSIKMNPRFKHIHHVVPSVSKARNYAEYAVDTDWLIFCDDDGYLENSYLKNLLRLIEEFPEVEIFAGGIKRIDNSDFYSKRHALGGDMKYFMNTKLLMGSNFVIKRSVFEELGKFDEKFGAGAPYGSSEETDLAWNAFFHHKRMRYSPELVVFHVPPFTGNAKNEIEKAFRYGQGKGALVRKWLSLGYFTVLYEVVEMVLLPVLKAPIFLLMFKFLEARIQLAALSGRLKGLFCIQSLH